MSIPKLNCRWCLNCTWPDEDFYYCDHFDFGMRKSKAIARRDCIGYRPGPWPCDDMDELADDIIDERELNLYKRRMAGDWS